MEDTTRKHNTNNISKFQCGRKYSASRNCGCKISLFIRAKERKRGNHIIISFNKINKYRKSLLDDNREFKPLDTSIYIYGGESHLPPYDNMYVIGSPTKNEQEKSLSLIAYRYLL